MMTESEALKNKIVREIGNLPEEKLSDVLNFVANLADDAKQPNGAKTGAPEQDPILKFIGGASHGSLAQGIDRDLYGP